MMSLMALDQSAAFDCVNHLILLRQLKMYGCCPDTIQWMSSYLQGRSQYVSIWKHESDYMSLDRGVPQGSILGPFIYLLYINEMAEVVKDLNCTNPVHSVKSSLFSENCSTCGQIVVYADDAAFVVSEKRRFENQRRLNLNLARLEIVLNTNDLIINVSKTAILETMIKQKKGRTPGEPPHLVVEDTENPGEHLRISYSKNFRILGANFQSNLSWQSHLETGKKSILPSIRSQLGSLQQMGRQLPRISRKILAEGLILSKFSYIITQLGGGNGQLTELSTKTSEQGG